MLLSNIDGIATGFLPGHVFKVPNRMNVRIKEDGQIEFVNDNALNKIAREYSSYGWKDQAWNKSLLDKGDYSWNNIFKAAKIESDKKNGWGKK